MKKIAVMMLVPNLHFSEMRDVGKESAPEDHIYGE
jgi:hypothetical protein